MPPPFPPPSIWKGRAHCTRFEHRWRKHTRCGFNPWVGKILWRRKWLPTQYSCLENPMDRETWWVIVQGRKESDITEWLSTQHTRRKKDAFLLNMGKLSTEYLLNTVTSTCWECLHSSLFLQQPCNLEAVIPKFYMKKLSHREWK